MLFAVSSMSSSVLLPRMMNHEIAETASQVFLETKRLPPRVFPPKVFFSPKKVFFFSTVEAASWHDGAEGGWRKGQAHRLASSLGFRSRGLRESLFSRVRSPFKARSQSFNKGFTDTEAASKPAITADPFILYHTYLPSVKLKPKEANGGTKASTFP